MGWGDFKLIGPLGFIFGWPDILMILILSFIIGSISVLPLLIKKKNDERCCSFWAVFDNSGYSNVFGYQIMDGYFGLFNLQ